MIELSEDVRNEGHTHNKAVNCLIHVIDIPVPWKPDTNFNTTIFPLLYERDYNIVTAQVDIMVSLWYVFLRPVSKLQYIPKTASECSQFFSSFLWQPLFSNYLLQELWFSLFNPILLHIWAYIFGLNFVKAPIFMSPSILFSNPFPYALTVCCSKTETLFLVDPIQVKHPPSKLWVQMYFCSTYPKNENPNTLWSSWPYLVP